MRSHTRAAEELLLEVIGDDASLTIVRDTRRIGRVDVTEIAPLDGFVWDENAPPLGLDIGAGPPGHQPLPSFDAAPVPAAPAGPSSDDDEPLGVLGPFGAPAVFVALGFVVWWLCGVIVKAGRVHGW